ncbi:unnamed protein product [Cochlearia groenlandica]
MACLEMYNTNSSSSSGTPMSPRISFSNDFVEIRNETNKTTRTIPLSKTLQGSDNFEFSVSNYTMLPADELFSKGKLLPFKETNQVQRTTLREELLVEEEEEDACDDTTTTTTNSTNIFSLKPPIFSSSSSSSSSKGRWKGLLGLKRAHIGSKINNKQSQQETNGGREG